MSWTQLLRKNNIVNTKDVLEQQLFNNSCIQHQKEPLSFNHPCHSNFKTINDIWNTAEKSFQAGNIIFARLADKRNWIAEYAMIKKTIPNDWKKILKNENIISDNDKMYKNKVILEIKYCSIFINGNEILLQNLRSKDIYFSLLYPHQHPSGITAWENITQKKQNWTVIFINLIDSLQSNKRKEFHWKCLHRAVFTEMRLKCMKRSDGICVLCESDDETTCHLLFECQCINKVWNNLAKIISDKTTYKSVIDLDDVLFNVKERENEELNQFLNYVIYEGKWQIWKNRNNVKYGKKEKKLVNDLVNDIKDQCKLHLTAFKTLERYTVKHKPFMQLLCQITAPNI